MRQSGNDVDHQYDGNTISDTFFCDSFTNPHQESTTSGKCCDRGNYIQSVELDQVALSAKTDCHCCGLDQCKRYGNVSGDGNHFFTAVFTVTLHFFQLWNSNCKQLHDNGRCNIRVDVQCQNRHVQERTARNGIKETERTACLLGKPLRKELRVHPGYGKL